LFSEEKNSDEMKTRYKENILQRNFICSDIVMVGWTSS